MLDIAYIALGSNLGDRAAHLSAARAALAALPLSRVVGASSVEETAPIGPVPRASYLNQMVAVETSLSPRALLDALLDIERAEGRVRAERWGPRSLISTSCASRRRRWTSLGSRCRTQSCRGATSGARARRARSAGVKRKPAARGGTPYAARRRQDGHGPRLRRAEALADKLVLVTAYDALFGRLVDESGVDAVLVGDSVGNVVAGLSLHGPGDARPDDLPRARRAARRHARAARRGHALPHVPSDGRGCAAELRARDAGDGSAGGEAGGRGGRDHPRRARGQRPRGSR